MNSDTTGLQLGRREKNSRTNLSQIGWNAGLKRHYFLFFVGKNQIRIVESNDDWKNMLGFF